LINITTRPSAILESNDFSLLNSHFYLGILTCVSEELKNWVGCSKDTFWDEV